MFKRGDVVEMWDEGQKSFYKKTTFVAVTSDGRFVSSDGNVWDNCRLINNTVLRKKNASEIVKMLEDDGFIFDNSKGYRYPMYIKNRDAYLLDYIFVKCGEIVNNGVFP